MLVQKLLDAFDREYETLHIDVNDVRDKLIDLGVQDQILFHFVDMDKEKVRGLLYRYSVSIGYKEPKLCADIIIPSDMGEEGEAWKRLVAVKELLHITDCDKLTAQSPDAVDNLFSKFSLPPELRNGGAADEPFNKSFLNDRVRIYFALAVLIPAKCRDKLRELYQTKLSDREIAAIAKVPERYIPVVMAEGFDSVIGTFIKWEIDEQISE